MDLIASFLSVVTFRRNGYVTPISDCLSSLIEALNSSHLFENDNKKTI